MVKICAWGTCDSDTRYPERVEGGIKFIPFPKPGQNLEKCHRWIRLCGRPKHQLNEDRLRVTKKSKHVYVCTKHFPDGGPTRKHPDPVSAVPHTRETPIRPPPKERTASVPRSVTAEPPSKRTCRQSLSETFRVFPNGRHEVSTAANERHDVSTAANERHEVSTAANERHEVSTAANERHEVSTAANERHEVSTAANERHEVSTAANDRHEVSTAANERHEVSTAANERHEVSTAANERHEVSTAANERHEVSTAANERHEVSTAANERHEVSTAANERHEVSTAANERHEVSTAANDRHEVSTAANERHEVSTAANERHEVSTAANERYEDSTEIKEPTGQTNLDKNSSANEEDANKENVEGIKYTATSIIEEHRRLKNEHAVLQNHVLNGQLDMLALAAENAKLKAQFASSILEKEDLIRKLVKQQNQDESTGCGTAPIPAFLTVESIRKRSTKDNDEFLHYTGLTLPQFDLLFKFLVPQKDPFVPSKHMKSVSSISLADQLLMVMARLRHNFDLAHLGHLSGISAQDASVLFSDWIQYMFYRCGSISIWPHRDVIIDNMPPRFKEEFPNTLVIIDGTELKLQRPSSLTRQSQTYSDYKSSNTLKGIVGIDPRGSIIFISMLCSGAMSDKEMTKTSGFLDTLREMLKNGKMKKGDGVMVDKGFRIADEIAELGLGLNIPPFARSGTQFHQSQNTQTEDIARHRVHVERAIARVKKFKILQGRIDISTFANVNQIWSVCCFITNFMPFLIQDKDKI